MIDFARPPLDDWTRIRLLVVGDVMLDEYLWGRVERISPEAPVPVVEVERETVVLGGAGNVVRNIRSLGAWVTLAGVRGEDETGRRLEDLLAAEGVDAAELLKVSGRRTSIKSRVMAGHQQVVRFDRESSQPIDRTTVRRITALAKEGLDQFDGLILSDYAKGVLTPGLIRTLIGLFRKAGKPVVADPKGRDFGRYKGATVLTPNRKEAGESLGMDCEKETAAAGRARNLLAKYGWEALLITRGAEGMSLFRSGRKPLHIPAQARQVFDVSGAGDTVAAVVGLSLASGWGLERAAVLGNLAGGVVVGKLATAPLTAGELHAAAAENSQPPQKPR